MNKAKTLEAPKGMAEPPAKGSEFKALMERAIRGDKSCQEQLDAVLDDPKNGPRIIGIYGNPPRFAEVNVVLGAAGNNLVVQESLTRTMASLRAELAGPEPSPIERLLAERADFCWFVVWRYEEHLTSAKDLTIKQADFHQRRIDAAHRRFLSALRTLAQVRKLALPSVQVNIGQNQVNVAGET